MRGTHLTRASQMVKGSVIVVDMSTDQERKLRLAESAAASAVLNGCDPDEVLRRCRVGIAEAIELNRRSARRDAEAA